MKKIVITITNNISYDQRMNKIASHYAKNHEVVIVGSSTRNPPPLEEKPYRQVRLKTFLQKGFLFYAEFNLRLILYLLSHKLDLIYAVDLDTVFAAYILKRTRGKDYIFDAHEYFTEVPELKGRTFVQKVWKGIEKRGISKAKSCLTVNQELANIFQKNSSKPFHVVRNVPIFTEIPQKPKENVLLYQGALNEGRGVEELIEMMKFFPTYTLEIAGDGPLMTKLKNLVESSGLKNVIFHGLVKPEKLNEITLKAKLGFNLLLGESLNYYYSLANKFFDYTMCNVPVVTMDFPVYRRLMDEFKVGELVTDLNVDVLRKTVQNMIEDESIYASYVNACKEAKQKWNWSQEIHVLDELIN